MNKESIVKELNKYSKDVIIQALIRFNLARLDKILECVKEINKTMQIEKLITRSDEISAEMEKLNLGDGIAARIKFQDLLDEDTKIQAKIDKFMNISV